ncbi:hypothetical protein EGW74_01645 [Enterococcus casseliflavus]|nr:hypothetical protein CO692_09435 [Enterococcus sp. FDAARGOS_375]AYJ44008.1 hypothetical protein D8N35_02415 [Enterococcus casseliflavus]RHH57437.1 hypothetical protein DW201_05520 [Enterococcus casseliflavus]ROY46728.1 hypothetical protein EGW74_01645 [Enterococcus casseliflavus]HCO70701.1 hypothetical protein [Enterococcus sp.]
MLERYFSSYHLNLSQKGEKSKSNFQETLTFPGKHCKLNKVEMQDVWSESPFSYVSSFYLRYSYDKICKKKDGSCPLKEAIKWL